MTCGGCSHFTPPAPCFESNSMGSCNVMDAWIEKHKPNKPKPKDYDKNFAMLGGKVWFTDMDRDCKRFQEAK